ncbi:tpr repeat containing exported protein [hydrocarbon metagenome]|uniref:Tpr repeat containing exported protein n=1 Tax=hydrocarbon metagenome TaxID=938273 RepID=A0A0W8G5A9_9ZZZZ
MNKTPSRFAAMLAVIATLLALCSCAPKKADPSAPAPLDTPADMWAEMENLKAEMRGLNAKVEELSYQAKSREGAAGAEMSGRVARLESQVAQMASQLAIDIEGAGPTASGPAAMAGVPAAPYSAQTGYPGQTAYAGQPAYPGQAATPTGVQRVPSYGMEHEEGDYEDVPVQRQPPYAQAPAVPHAQVPVAPAAQPGAPVLDPPKDPADALYTQALQAFNAKQYRDALSMWTEFTKNFPKSPLVPNTYFWIGECNYQVGDFANAVLSYQEVIDKFPKSNKYPDALFKRGAAFLKLNNKQAAKISFQELITKYPNSPLTQRAKAMMPK